jgi:hypothetical protein
MKKFILPFLSFVMGRWNFTLISSKGNSACKNPNSQNDDKSDAKVFNKIKPRSIKNVLDLTYTIG